MSESLVRAYDPEREEERTERARVQIGEASPDVRSISLVILVVLAVLYTLYLAQGIILPFVVAGVLNLLLQPAKRFLSGRLRLPGALSSLLLILALFGVVGVIAAGISLPASTWIARAPEALPRLQEKLGPLKQPIEYAQKGLQQIEHMFDQAGAQTAPEGQPAPTAVTVRQPSNLGQVGLTVLAGTRAFVAELFTVLVILFFLLWAGDTLVRSLVEIMPRFSDKRRIVEISSEIERNISGYLATITMMNAIVGVATGLATWACGLPDPLLWGTLAFLLNYIPILGPVSGIVILFVVGLFVYPVIWWAFLPAGIYLLIHLVEGETVTPMLVASRFTLNPVLVILSLFFWDFMWGVIGAFLAVPLLAICKILCDHVESLTPVGHLLGGGHKGVAAAAVS